LDKHESKNIEENFVSGSVLDQLIFLLGKAIQKLTECQKETMGPVGFSRKHLKILLAIHEKISINQGEIGRFAYIDRSTVVKMIDDLEKWGMVQRIKNAADRRSYKILLTVMGKGLIPKACVGREITTQAFVLSYRSRTKEVDPVARKN
jgi:DNA-binding MarR family transcriptional regulator